jgi:hypothetical protein
VTRSRWALRPNKQYWSEIDLPDYPGWSVAACFIPVNDRPVLVELRVVPAQQDNAPGGSSWWPGEWERTKDGVLDPDGIPMYLLKEIRAGDLFEPIQKLAQNLAYAGRKKGSNFGADEKVWRRFAEAPDGRSKDDLYYAKWAARISEKTTDPGTRNRPIAALADDTGLEREQIRDIAHRARRLKVLSDPPTRGRGGGLLTEKGRRLLSEASKKKGKARK